MDYKKIIYDNYVRGHAEGLYGAVTIQSIKKMFPAWRYYFSAHLPSDHQANILDVGCGEGGFVYWLQQQGYHKSFGVDVSAQQIAVGKELGIKNIECDDLSVFLNQNSEDFDLIIARDVIEHFTKQEVFNIFNLINKKLKPGGSLIIQVPNGQGIFFGEVFYGDYTHEMPYTEWSLNQIANNTGFDQVICKPVNPVPQNFTSIIRLIIWKVFILFIRLIKSSETGNFSGIFTRNLIAIIKK